MKSSEITAHRESGVEQSSKSAWKDLIIGAAYGMKLLELGRFMRRNRITILCYHRFSSEAISNGALFSDLFEDHLNYLKRHFTLISFRDMQYLLNGRLHVKSPLILTVDDGYKDFIDVALPVLKKHRVPATLFVTVRFVDGEIWLWPDIVTYSIRNTSKTEVDLPEHSLKLALHTADDRIVARNMLTAMCKKMNNEQLPRFLDDLADRLQTRIPSVPPPEFRSVSWDDLRSLDRTLIEVGSHTLTHPILSRISTECAEKEIAESKRRIEQELDMEIQSFAYPNGLPEDYTPQNKRIVKDSGYRYAVSCNFGFNEYVTDMLDLKRIVPSDDLPRFVQYVSGFESLKRRMKNVMNGGSSPLHNTLQKVVV